MKVANTSLPITITGRHIALTDALRNHVKQKVESIQLDYPRVIEAKVILDVQKKRQTCEIILHCADHITLEASSESATCYASIDKTVQKVARQMRKRKTRTILKHRAGDKTIRHLNFQEPELEPEPTPEPEPFLLHRENCSIRSLKADEAIEDLENNQRSFVLFQNEDDQQLNILYRRQDGEYAIVQPDLGQLKMAQ
ncbi:MAG: ribosome-associated translation inhibitor RaiA [Verrucomicrobiota bacterium]